MAVKRGEIYFVDLNPAKGKEQTGTRPVLILSIDAINKLPLVVTVVVGTEGKNITHDYPTNVRVPPSESGLPMETVFLCFQIRSIDSARFPKQYAGKVSDEIMRKIENAVRYSLGL